MSYEYKIHLTKETGLLLANIDLLGLEDQLNGFGNQGWELVSSFMINQSVTGRKALALILKRSVTWSHASEQTKTPF